MKRFVMEASPLGPSGKVKAAVRKAAKDLNSSPADEKNRLGRLFHSRFGIGAESLLFGSSLKELLTLACRSRQLRRALIAGPAPSLYGEAAAAAAVAVEYSTGSEENDFLTPPEALLSAAAEAGCLILANPNRITGRAYAAPEIERLADEMEACGAVLILDESLRGFTGGGSLAGRAAESGNLIVLGSTAAYFGLPGLELAAAVSSPAGIGAMSSQVLGSPSLLAFSAARAALRDSSYRGRMGRFLEEETHLFRKTVGRCGGMTLFRSDANIFLLKAEMLPRDFAARAAAGGLAVESCEAVEGLDGRFLRISLMKHEQNLKLARLLQKIASAGNSSPA